MASVRTKRLARGNIGAAGVDNLVYTAPAGETVIVKDIRLASFATALTRAQLWVESGAVQVRLVDTAMGTNDRASLMPWCVLQPGDELHVQASHADTLAYWVSGTELEGVAD